MKKSRRISSARRLAAVAGIMLSTALLAACSSGTASAPVPTAIGATPINGCPKPASITIWGIQTSPSQQAFDQEHAAAFEKACPGVQITYSYSKNTALKEKLTAAMAAGTPPTVFQSFGAGDLKPYATEGKVENLDAGMTKVDSSWKGKFLPSSLVPGTFNGKEYGFPVWGAQPKLLFYNKTIFEKVGITPPKTLDDLNKAIDKIKKAGIIPIALGNKDQNPSTYWLGYLTSRAGGMKPYENVYAGKSNAWSDPAFTTALKQLQEMGSTGAFGSGFDSIGDVDGAANALLFTGRAAMKLDGTWLYNAIDAANPQFIKDGDLGYVAFPLGSNKDNNAVFGNASAVYSVTTDSTAAQKAVAYAYLTSQLTSKNYAKGQAEIGYVPALKGMADVIPSAGVGAISQLAYKTAEDPTAYQVDPQVALGPTGTIYMNETADVTNSSISPQKFVADMNATIK